MKISQKQAGLLAKQIKETLLKQRIQKLPEGKRQELKEFYADRKQLLEVCSKADAELRKHDSLFFNLIGRKNNIYVSTGLESVIEKMEAANVPSVQDIEDKIILKSMFANDSDMETFMALIVKEFTKRKTVSAN